MSKGLQPHLREKKRYLAIEAITENEDFSQLRNAVLGSLQRFAGSKGASEAGAIMLKERYNAQKKRALVRVNHKHLDTLKASLCFINDINGKKAVVRSIGASGILKKAYEKYIQ